MNIYEENNNELLELTKERLINIQKALDKKDTEQLKNYIIMNKRIVQSLLNSITIDKIAYIIMQFKISKVKESYIANESFCSFLTNIDFEKKALLELKTILNSIKKNENYNYLPLSFHTLIFLAIMQNKAREIVITDFKCNLSNIVYLPAISQEKEIEKFKDKISKNIKILKRENKS